MDYYQILNVRRDASPEAIEKAYYRTLRDHKQRVQKLFTDQEIALAYNTLRNPESRSLYDVHLPDEDPMPMPAQGRSSRQKDKTDGLRVGVGLAILFALILVASGFFYHRVAYKFKKLPVGAVLVRKDSGIIMGTIKTVEEDHFFPMTGTRAEGVQIERPNGDLNWFGADAIRALCRVEPPKDPQ